MIKKLFVTALVCTLPVSAVAQLSDVPDAPKVMLSTSFTFTALGSNRSAYGTRTRTTEAL